MTEGPDLPLPGAKPFDQIRPDEKCKACEPPVRFNGVPVDVLPAATGIERLTYNVPGLIGDLIEWNVATARSPSRIMALAAGIAVVGKLLDRKVAVPTSPQLTFISLCWRRRALERVIR
jgi:hypothetical protein